ncbi:benzoate/H(+) symporter BenE family transporter [Pseudomonas cichorii]|uniref:Benzoate/H(+) symporter BenE family transporter n=1 Tax=Pseudomonas lijiangensis TaxID=2995658 RepID=A0ABX8HWM9_9PSED|nr:MULTISPECIES: benzoate/H(+) symporter BenE family transporter [Pseudomonas syringae group]MBX8500594.1 benzoate/H(+) symporter BenE family transporter [Pseudomonas lijiangensis]MBX8504948.1 benzoate/H(+) symporter BenE family transporter [Pseudomonas lijiangensis]MBX8512331.1 benzoate/H(+) symporter BenE family transporter [Pseudomonas cichorii]MBX8527372.1 benzoate/H(+) symporter BenE family transporter [Pseudomonas cichorii]MBX8541020.1 benzoate/H(+) symporter BenE family transporter [Pse
MNETLKAPLRPLADSSPSAVVAGFIAMMTGCTSSLVLMLQAGQTAGLSTGQMSSWLLSMFIGMAVCSIGLSLRYRTPISVAWSTPGAALLITTLGGVGYPEAIGAFITCSILVIICGMTGSFERLVKRLPASLAAALLAGILFKIGSDIFIAVQHRTGLVLAMFFTYLLIKRISPRYSVLAALVVGIAAASLLGLLNFNDVTLEVATPVWTTPSFSLAATISISIPLFVVAMTSQNMPGIAVLRADGYHTPSSPLITATGITSLLTAPFGCHGLNLAAISAAICTSPNAHEDKSKRYTAAVWCGVFYGVAGIFGATLAALFAAFPKELVLSIAALALFGSLINGLTVAMNEPREREAALITFMVTASGLTLFSIGSALWGIVAGVLTLVILNTRKGA